jgi:hypothetical protein
MGAFAPILLAVTTVASGAASAALQRRSGKLQEIQYKENAKQEGDAAKQREIDRKRNMLRALASQNAAAGASGADFAGSLQNIARVDIERAATDLNTDRTNTSRRTRVLNASGKEAARSGDIAAAGSLIDTAGQAYKNLG